MNRCPDKAQLESFLVLAQGTPPDAALESHINNCDSCQDQIRRILLDRTGPAHEVTPADAVPSPPEGYELVERVGRGGMGEVWKARQLRPRRLVALKFTLPGRRHDPRVRERFLAEVEITSRLDHPGVVPVHALGEDGRGEPCSVMRLVSGRTMAEAIEVYLRARTTNGLRDLLRHLIRVCETVAYANSKGVVHRDLKPGNIILGDFGETIVLDWGLAKVLGDQEPERTSGPFCREGLSEAVTHAGTVLGTPAYMSPEQAGGDPEAVGTATDVFALGTILYEVLCGRPPYAATDRVASLEAARAAAIVPPSRQARAVPAALEAIALKAMARRPEARYPSAVELARDLDRWLTDQAVSSWKESTLTRLARWTRRHQTLAALLLLLLFLGAISAPLGYAIRQRQQQEKGQRLATEAEELSLRGNWAEALKKYDEALATAPTDPVSLRLRKVRAWRALGQLKESRRELASLAAGSGTGTVPEVLLWRGDDLIARNQIEQGKVLVRQARPALRAETDQLYADALLADRSEQAESSLRRVVSLDPFHRDAQTQLLALHILDGQHDDVERRASSVAELFPNDPNYPLARAIVAALRGDKQHAREFVASCADRLDETRQHLAGELIDDLAEVGAYMNNGDLNLTPAQAVALHRLFVTLAALQTEGEEIRGEGVLWAGDVLRLPPCVSDLLNNPRFRLAPASLPDVRRQLNEFLANVEAIHPDGMIYFVRGLDQIQQNGRKAEDEFLRAVATPSVLPHVRREAYFYAALAAQQASNQGDPDGLKRSADYLRKRLAFGPLSRNQSNHPIAGLWKERATDVMRSLVDHALSETPQDPGWLFRKAQCSFWDERYPEAIDAAEGVLRQGEDHAAARFYRAEAVLGVDRQVWKALRPSKATAQLALGTAVPMALERADSLLGAPGDWGQNYFFAAHLYALASSIERDNPPYAERLAGKVLELLAKARAAGWFANSGNKLLLPRLRGFHALEEREDYRRLTRAE
jgi:serine/threonine protein kinase